MNLSIHEQLHDVDKTSDKKEKIAKLQGYFKESNTLAIVFDLTYNDKIKWLLPPGTPPYNMADRDQDNQNVFKNSARKLQYFINTKVGNEIKPMRRELMFIELLESVHCDDAKLLLSMKDKKLPFKSITKKFIQNAFPNETKSW